MQTNCFVVYGAQIHEIKTLAFATAYIIKSPDLLWVETTYQVTGVGKIHVDTPLNTSLSYGVGVRTSAKEVLATWVVPPSESGLDLVTNGSFENYTQGGIGSFFPEIFRDGDWQASLRNADPAQNECPKPYLEIQASDPVQASASDGNYMMDTNSGCVINNTIASNPVIIWQEMKSKTGHLYEFMFDARRNPNSIQNVLGVNFAGKAVIANEFNGTGNGTWAPIQRFLIASDRDGGRIEFMDLKPNGDGRGALIDNVRFYDLGMPPQ
ncbi:MAG: hypothetical protein EOP07_13240 [Proteobacteria bacterium]|nr:MAG: hypothetical protein EOP07_13240 [Pseudomonadota bacterium]